MNSPLVLVVALAQERRALQGRLASVHSRRQGEFRLVLGELGGRGVILVQAGIGRNRARGALLAASRLFSLRAAWSLGFAGGLSDALMPGDLVCPAVVLQDDGVRGRSFVVPGAHAAVCSGLRAARIPVHTGPLLTVDVPLRTPEAKRGAHRRTGAVAVDMEAAGVAEAAGELGIPWLALKAVVDPAGELLPEFLAGCTTPHGNVRWRGVISCLFAGGGRRRTLQQLGWAARQAALGLTRSLDVVFQGWEGALTTPPLSSRM